MHLQAVAFSPSGKFLAVGFSSGTLKIYEFKCPEAVGVSATAGGDEMSCLDELIGTRESREAVTHVNLPELLMLITAPFGYQRGAHG